MSSSSSRRRAALCCLGVLAVTTTACSISDTPANDAGADDVSWLFSQTSDSGQLELTDGEITGLVMSGVDLHTIMFADRPDRLTDVIDTAAITEQWDDMFADSAPNAVLVEHQPDGATNSLVVVLRRPVLDTVAGTLSYDIEVLADEQHPDSIDGLVGDLYDDPPAEFGAVSLFIDNAPQRRTGPNSEGYQEPPPPPEEVPPPPDAPVPPPPTATVLAPLEPRLSPPRPMRPSAWANNGAGPWRTPPRPGSPASSGEEIANAVSCGTGETSRTRSSVRKAKVLP